MIALNKNERAFYKKMLSNTSKLGCKSISLNAKSCKTGSKLAKKKGSVCFGCYALRDVISSQLFKMQWKEE